MAARTWPVLGISTHAFFSAKRKYVDGIVCAKRQQTARKLTNVSMIFVAGQYEPLTLK